MTKVLLLLSAVVMAVACFFSYQNRTTFVQTRKDYNDNTSKISLEMKALSSIESDLNNVGTQRDSMKGELEQEDERLAQSKIKLKNAQSENERTAADLASTQAETKDLKDKTTNFPAGVTLETIAEDINKLKQSVADNELKVGKLKEETTSKEKELKKEVAEQDEVTKRLEERKKMFQRNSLTSTVVAVNNDWGFVVIDGGRNQGITTDTRLIITRGSQTVGKLSIVSVENNKTVANIIHKSLHKGISVAPGDKVILESLYQ
ncbi:MAG: hypothetical protein WCN98_05860 [Verrucomicrobiaceae bacterium]